ncbi:MAG: UDP-N-acetylglucosamine 1-carboxyvinyltransferase, partial [Chryseotalea sp.]
MIFRIQGGKKLKGEIIPQGAKNEALQIVSAVLLTAKPVTIDNLPDIRDVNKLIELVADLGCKVENLGKGSFKFTASNINMDYLESADYRQKAAALRGSVMLLGPILARFGKASLPKPGGDKIGRRRLDTHFLGFQKLGAKFNFDASEHLFHIDASELTGCYMLLDEASVTGTANIIMAAVLAKGKTTLYNAACEPYLQQLCLMLNRMGANISGIGSNLLTIEGVSELNGTEHTLLPDMIEIGSFIGLAAMTQSEITIKNCRIDMLGIIPDVFKRLGIKMEFRGDDIYIPSQNIYEIDTFIDGSILTIADAPWPGFTPDLLSIV